jgi:hypothetical protein
MYGLKPVPFTVLSFSAACKARVDITGFMYGLKPVPFTLLSFSAACKAMPFQNKIFPNLEMRLPCLLVSHVPAGSPRRQRIRDIVLVVLLLALLTSLEIEGMAGARIYVLALRVATRRLPYSMDGRSIRL